MSIATSAVGLVAARFTFPLVAVLSLGAAEFEVGLLSAMSGLALLLFGLPAGAWVDRTRRRRVLIVADLARAGVLMSIPLAWWMDFLTIWQMYVAALLMNTGTVFFEVAYRSYLPSLVGREHLVEGNAKLEAVRSASIVAGPAMGGQLVAILTAPFVLIVTSLAMVTSSLFVTAIRKNENTASRRADTSLGREIIEGLRFVLGGPLLRAMALSVSWSNFWASTYAAMWIVYMVRVLELSPGKIGAILGLGGAGAVLGAMVARRIVRWLGQGPTMWVSMLVGAPFHLVLPLVAADWRIWLAGGAMGVAACAVVVSNIAQTSAQQEMTGDAMLGRMSATMRVLTWGVMPVGSLLGGLLGAWLGPRATLVIAASAGCLAFLPILLSPLRAMRDVPKYSLEEDLVSGAVGPQ
jgi:predicted MFS family arabinose efflux permease